MNLNLVLLLSGVLQRPYFGLHLVSPLPFHFQLFLPLRCRPLFLRNAVLWLLPLLQEIGNVADLCLSNDRQILLGLRSP